VYIEDRNYKSFIIFAFRTEMKVQLFSPGQFSTNTRSNDREIGGSADRMKVNNGTRASLEEPNGIANNLGIRQRGSAGAVLI